MKKGLLIASTLVPLVMVAGCGAPTNSSAKSTPNQTSGASSTSNTTSNTTNASTSSPSGVTKASFTMTLETGKMDGKPGWPVYTPGNLILPANADVTLTINSYDDGSAAIPAGDNQVKGTVDGSMTVNGQSVTSIPTNDVAHTLTISSIGLNVPIEVKSDSQKYSTTTFTFHTPSDPTTLDWQCMAACGTGKSGWEGPMATNGMMKGTFTVVNNFYAMTVDTGKQDGKPGWPKFVPANLTLPANQDVTIAIESYDDGNAGIPAGDNQAKGIVGQMLVDGTSVSSIPTKNVAHTLTISKIGLNVPITVKTTYEPYSTTEFTFHTPSSPTTLDWQCMAACGTGASGWEGPMSTSGWMQGTFSIK